MWVDNSYGGMHPACVVGAPPAIGRGIKRTGAGSIRVGILEASKSETGLSP